MKRTLLFLLIGALVFSGCSRQDESPNHLEGLDSEAIRYLANDIYDFYKTKSVNYTEFEQHSIFKFIDDNNDYVVCEQAKTERNPGYDTFTIIYRFNNKESHKTSIVSSTSAEYGDEQTYKLYYFYQNEKEITYIDRDLANQSLRSWLSYKFSKGMEEHYEEGKRPDALFEKDFEYIIENNEVSITKWVGTDDIIRIPSIINGLPVTRIKKYAFKAREVMVNKNKAIVGNYPETVILPDTIKYIEEQAFYNDYGYLEKYQCTPDYIFIPENIKNVHSSAFSPATKLFYRGFNVDAEYSDVNEEDLYIDRGLIFKRYRYHPLWVEAILVDCLHKNTKAIIPAVIKIGDEVMTVTQIADYAFYECQNLERIEFPETMNSLNFDGFQHNWSTIDAEIEYNFPKLQFNIYKNGYYLPSAANPYFLFYGQVDENQKVTFHDDTKQVCLDYDLSDISFTTISGIDYIPSDSNPYFFGRNTNETYSYANNRIVFNNNTKIVYPHVWPASFEGHTFCIPKGVTYICLKHREELGYNAFEVESGNNIYQSDAYGVLFGDFGVTLEYAGYTGLSDKYIVPNHVWFIADYAFSRVRYTEVTFSDYVNYIGKRVFYCGSSILNIGKSSFNIYNLCGANIGFSKITVSPENLFLRADDNCLTLIGIVLYCVFGSYDDVIYRISNSISYISHDAFNSGIRNVKAFIIPDSVIQVGHSDRIDNNAKIYQIASEEKYTSYETYDDVIYEDDAIYTIKKGQASINQCFSTKYNFVLKDKINNVPIRTISSEAFEDCASKQLTCGDFLRTISASAFSKSKFESLIIPYPVTYIGGNAFYASHLKWVVIPESVVTFGEYCFTYSINCIAYLELDEIPSSWSNKWCNSGAGGEGQITYYLKSQWHYEDGVPTPNKS